MRKLFRDRYPALVPYIASHTWTDLERVTYGSQKAVTARCPQAGHEWTTTFRELGRLAHQDPPCAQCRRRSLFDELPVLRPFYAGTDADYVTPRSTVPVLWRDGEGEWYESPNDLWRRRSHLRPEGIRRPTLRRAHPELLPWLADPDDPAAERTPMRHVPVLWRCPEGHEFLREVYRFVRSRRCQVCEGREIGDEGQNTVAERFPELAARWSQRNPLRADQVHAGSKEAWLIAVEGGGVQRVAPASYDPQARAHDSTVETQVAAYVHAQVAPLGLHMVRRDRLALRPREVDIYLPDLSLAIEVNGLYWHSEQTGKGRLHHHAKYLSAREAGIDLLVVWEDDWRDRREAVEALIASKLGTLARPRVGARTTQHVPSTYAESAAFLERHHVQGAARGTFYDTLVAPDGTTVAVMVTRRAGSRYLIERYATAAVVPGGFGKLLAVLTRRIAAAGGGEVVTFSDNAHSSGALYARTGFTVSGEVRPDYRYVVERTRRHKFGYRLKRFRTDPDLEYREGMSESELAELNGLPRIWDYGKLRWVLPVHP